MVCNGAMAFRSGYDYGQDGPYVQYYENILASKLKNNLLSAARYTQSGRCDTFERYLYSDEISGRIARCTRPLFIYSNSYISFYMLLLNDFYISFYMLLISNSYILPLNIPFVWRYNHFHSEGFGSLFRRYRGYLRAMLTWAVAR
jgi:hypothetical protein